MVHNPPDRGSGLTGVAPDTIVASATAPGVAAVGVVRISGERTPEVAAGIVGTLPPPRRAALRSFRDTSGQIVDQGLAIYFPAPASFTGEEVLELHCHGSPVLQGLLIEAAVSHGCRPARPGEFSERAFRNGRIDLAQAEAIADLISADSEVALRNAQRSLQGAFSERVNAAIAGLVTLRTRLEATLDFPDDDLGELPDTYRPDIAEIRDVLEQTLAQARQGQRYQEGMRVALIGRPNVGKSSILNRLSGEETAIVSAEPGTTRDVLRASVVIDGLPLHLVDTAGLRTSDDPVEQEGVRRAREQLQRADLVLLVTDAAQRSADERDYLPLAVAGQRWLVLVNKIDLSGERPGPLGGAGLDPAGNGEAIGVSALRGDGFAEFEQALRRVAGTSGSQEGLYSARQRHLVALEQALTALQRADEALAGGLPVELAAADLTDAQQHLGRITGQVTSDDLLGEIFSRFCIGK